MSTEATKDEQGEPDLLRNVFHVLPDKVIAGRVEQDGKTPWIPESDDMRLLGEELDVEHAKEGNLLSCDG